VASSDQHRVTVESLRRLLAVADAALAHLDLDELLAGLDAPIRDLLEADSCAILLLEKATSELAGNRFAGRIAAERRPMKTEYAVGVPLLVGDELVGVLEVGVSVQRDFTPEDVELLELAAERVALAIDRSRALEAERRTAEGLLKLQTISDAALAHLSLDELLAELLERMRTILAADTCAVLLLDPETSELVARAARGIEDEAEHRVRIPVGKGFAGRIAAERRPVVIDDVDHADVLNPILRERGIKSLLGVPLLVRGEVLGVIHVGTLTPRRFGPGDVELLERAAERAATGLERALVHEELMRLDRVRHALVSIASHELRTPTAAVLGAALTLGGRELAPEQESELKRLLVEQAQRLADLIEQLLDLSRLEARAVQIRPVRVEVRDRIEEIVAAVAPTLADRIDIEAEPDLVIEADPVALERVVSNLVVNALRHGAPPVSISAEVHDRHLRLTVEDRGGGVPDDVRPRLFEQFSRSAEAAGTQGTGLGLAIAKSYAQAHGGDLVFDSGYDAGARFQLVLPVGKPRASSN